MTVFVDTSALLALIVPSDRFHDAALGTLKDLHRDNETLATHNYLVVEAISVVHRRFGGEVTRALVRNLLPELDVIWVEQASHAAALAALVAALPTSTSLVDFVSFEVMRQHGLDRAFAFDADFAMAGFRVMPEPPR